MQRSGRSYDAGSHPEFNNLVEITASNLNILPGLVLKDYWVTRILRTIATDSELSKYIIFKGGTSLSKGWQLIDRFSEDVDLLTTGPEFSAPPGKNAREKVFKAIKQRVEEQTGLRWCRARLTKRKSGSPLSRKLMSP